MRGRRPKRKQGDPSPSHRFSPPAWFTRAEDTLHEILQQNAKSLREEEPHGTAAIPVDAPGIRIFLCEKVDECGDEKCKEEVNIACDCFSFSLA